VRLVPPAHLATELGPERAVERHGALRHDRDRASVLRRRRRVEHWNLPTETGKRAGQLIAAHLRGEDCEPLAAAGFAPLPSFWSDQYDMHLLAFGMTYLADRRELVAGSLDDECVVEYFRGETLVGVCGIGMRSLVQSYRSRFSVPSATV